MRSCRCWVLVGALATVTAVVWNGTVTVAGQTPRTPWGDPDLQGVWTNWDETPFQAPDPANRERVRPPVDPRVGREDGIAGGMASVYFGPVSPRRPGAVVVDPPDGRVPVIPARRRVDNLRAMGDHWTNHGAWQRCITAGVPGRLLAGGTGGYSRAYRILQSPGFVVIFPERVHDARIVPLDGRPHVGSSIRMWNGDSRGRWEEQTLVVETTNFNDTGDGIAGAPQSEALRVVERFTRIDAKTLNYEVTITDPNAYTRPWTARQPHNLDPTFVIYEVACHEGNTRFMEGALEMGRLRDAEAAEAAAKKNATR